MLATVYQLLDRLGYPHPIHPSEVHLPIGLLIGALVFRLSAGPLRRPALVRTAYHCLVLGLVALIPTVLFGVMDWQHFYAGAWLRPFEAKMALTALLVAATSFGVVAGVRKGADAAVLPFVYAFSVLIVVVIGYIGGDVVYGAAAATPASTTRSDPAKAAIYSANCAGCHPRGGNVIDPAVPVLGSAMLKDPATFLSFVRHPARPDGSASRMPPFPPERLSDHDAQLLYEYIGGELGKD